MPRFYVLQLLRWDVRVFSADVSYATATAVCSPSCIHPLSAAVVSLSVYHADVYVCNVKNACDVAKYRCVGALGCVSLLERGQ